MRHLIQLQFVLKMDVVQEGFFRGKKKRGKKVKSYHAALRTWARYTADDLRGPQCGWEGTCHHRLGQGPWWGRWPPLWLGQCWCSELAFPGGTEGSGSAGCQWPFSGLRGRPDPAFPSACGWVLS